MLYISLQSSVDITGVLTVDGSDGYGFVLSSTKMSEPSDDDFTESLPMSTILQTNIQYDITLTFEQSTNEWLLLDSVRHFFVMVIHVSLIYC